jgi:hypothetical protein
MHVGGELDLLLWFAGEIRKLNLNVDKFSATDFVFIFQSIGGSFFLKVA